MKRLIWFLFLVLLPVFVHAQLLPTEETNDDPTILRSGPSEDYDRIAELPKGLRFQLELTQKNWSKVRVSKTLSGWIETKSLKELVPAAAVSHPTLQYIKIKKEEGDVRMEITETEPGVVLAEQWIRPSVLWLKFQNTQAALSEIDYDVNDPIVLLVSVNQEFEDVVFMRIDLKHLYGYELIQKDPKHLVVKFKLRPRGASLEGLKICIDPGHGGKDTGAIGPTGLKEKMVALAVSKTLGKLLSSRGAQVIFTRTDDVSLADPEAPVLDELRSRVDVARKNNANVFISIHCNARPTKAEGRTARGSYVYFYQPQSLTLAEEVSESLEREINEPTFGVIFRSFHVIRETELPAILVETAFISNPFTEARLRKKSYQEKIAWGIFRGILSYARLF